MPGLMDGIGGQGGQPAPAGITPQQMQMLQMQAQQAGIPIEQLLAILSGQGGAQQQPMPEMMQPAMPGRR